MEIGIKYWEKPSQINDIIKQPVLVFQWHNHISRNYLVYQYKLVQDSEWFKFN